VAPKTLFVTFAQDYALAASVQESLQRAVKEKLVDPSEGRILFNQIIDVNITPGSVVVTATVDPSVTDDVVATTQSIVDSGSFTVVVDDVHEFTSVPAAATSTSAPDDLADNASSNPDASSDITRMQLLAIIIGSIVVALIIAIAVIIIRRQRQNRRSAGGKRSMVAHANPVYSAGNTYQGAQGTALDETWRETNDMEC
jgi:hypothetical protein